MLVMLGVIDAKPKVGYFIGKSLSAEGMLHSKFRGMKVKEVMGRPTVVRENGTVNDAVIQLFVENTGLLLVVDEAGYLTGMLSMKDLLKVTLGNPNAASVPIQMAMTRLPRVVMVNPEDSVLDAAQIMIDHQISGLPVVVAKDSGQDEKSYEVVGRITKTHILQLLLEYTIES